MRKETCTRHTFLARSAPARELYLLGVARGCQGSVDALNSLFLSFVILSYFVAPTPHSTMTWATFVTSVVVYQAATNPGTSCDSKIVNTTIPNTVLQTFSNVVPESTGLSA